MVKQFEINRRIIFIELRNLKRYIKDMNITNYEKYTKNFLIEVLNDNFADKLFKSFAIELLLYFENYKNIKEID